MIQNIAQFFTNLCMRFLPSAFVFSVILTLVVFILGMILEDNSVSQMLSHWGGGFWKLHTFSMQMVLMLVFGHALAQTAAVKKVLQTLAQTAKTKTSAIVLVSVVSAISCWVNWGFGLIVGALLCVEVAKKVKDVPYALLVASAYSGFLVWHAGLSGSIPLKLASSAGFMADILGDQVIPTSETIFSSMNLTLSLALIFTLPVLNILMIPESSEQVVFEEEAAESLDNNENTFATKLERSKILMLLVCGLGFSFLVYEFVQKPGLGLNRMIMVFLFLAMFFHKDLFTFNKAIVKAVSSSSGIILQFPFYAGIMGMMSGSGLASSLSQFFVETSSSETFGLMTYLSAGIVNFFVPSGGGQWAVQGPIVVPAAKALGYPIEKAAMALAWGDAWTNMVQPFWALPLLSMAKMELRQIMGYCVVIFLWAGLLSCATIYFI